MSDPGRRRPRPALVVPHPPLLARELTGPGAAAAELLRAACADGLAHLFAKASGRVLVVGGGGETRRHADDAWGSLGGFGVALEAPERPLAAPEEGHAGAATLPLSLTIGSLLLDRAGYRGERVLQEVATTSSPGECADLGEELVADHPDAVWLLLADGTVKRTERAPGAFDPRAAGFDAQVEAAFAAGDADALLQADPALADSLGAAGRAVWQVLAGAWCRALGSGPIKASVDYADAPFGVGYLVARWS